MNTTNQLPPLPTPKFTETIRGVPCITVTEHEHLMRAYALQARAQVQGEPMAWLHWLNGPVRVFMNKDEAMMELDRLNREYPVDSGDRKMRPLILGDTAPQPAQATQAEVTRDEVMQAAKEATAPEWQDVVDGWHMGLDLMAFARAILALRPERAPMTMAQVNAAWDGLMPSGFGKSRYDITRLIEAHHGITAQAKKEGV